MFIYFLVAGNLTEKLLKFSVLKEQSWNWHAVIHSKNWGSKLKPPTRSATLKMKKRHYFPIDKHISTAFTQQSACLIQVRA